MVFITNKFCFLGQDYVRHMHLRFGDSISNINQLSSSLTGISGQYRPNKPSQMVGMSTYVAPPRTFEAQLIDTHETP